MNLNHIYNVLSDAKFTIEQQRREIAALQPRADAYDRIGQILDLAEGDRRGECASIDPIWDITRALEEIQNDQAKEKQQAAKSPGLDTFTAGRVNAMRAEQEAQLARAGLTGKNLNALRSEQVEAIERDRIAREYGIGAEQEAQNQSGRPYGEAFEAALRDKIERERQANTLEDTDYTKPVIDDYCGPATPVDLNRPRPPHGVKYKPDGFA